MLFSRYKKSKDTLLILRKYKNVQFWEKFLLVSKDENNLLLVRVSLENRNDTLHFKNIRKLKENNIIAKKITLVTTSCLGSCPVVEFSLMNKQLIITGLEHTKHVGNFICELKEAQIQRINDLINLLEMKNNHICFLPFTSDAWHCKMEILCNNGKSITGAGRIGTLEQSFVVGYLAYLESILDMAEKPK